MLAPRALLIKSRILSSFGSIVSATRSVRSAASPVTSRYRRRSMAPMLTSSQVTTAAGAFVSACEAKGGLSVLEQISQTGSTTVNEFCSFCQDRLQVDQLVALAVLDVLDTTNGVVNLHKLTAVLRLSVRSDNDMQTSCISSAASASPDSRRVSIADTASLGRAGAQALAARTVLDSLADLLDMGVDELRTLLQRSGMDPADASTRAAFQQMVDELIQSEAQFVKLPQGLNAPFVAARHREQNLGYSVPVWSLRAQLQAPRKRRDSAAFAGARMCLDMPCFRGANFAHTACIVPALRGGSRLDQIRHNNVECFVQASTASL